MDPRTFFYFFYKHRVHPKIKYLRGTTRLLNILERFARTSLPRIDEDPKPISEIEWDNLIILDEARYDIYREFRPDSDYRITQRSTTRGFIEANFSDRMWPETVYIAGNPHFHEEVFEEITGKMPSEVFLKVYKTFDQGWSDEKGTVMPSEVARDALDAEKKFPNKRKIIHYMQPHAPFLESEIRQSQVNRAGVTREVVPEPQLAEKGRISPETVIEHYKRNLEIALESALEVADDLKGETVVSSDHGVFLGEKGFFEKCSESDALALRKVPVEKI